jgi:hypothetical protein
MELDVDPYGPSAAALAAMVEVPGPLVTFDEMTAAVLDTLARTTLSPDAVLSVPEVVHALGGRQSVVRGWLRSDVIPLRHPSGRMVYRWGDVLDAMRRAA